MQTNVLKLLEELPPIVVTTAKEAHHANMEVRVYHTWDHALDVLAAVGSVLWDSPMEMALAAIYHDAVYEVGAKDNEARSAELFLTTWDKYNDGMYLKKTLVARAIKNTALHLEAHTVADLTSNSNVSKFMDCDMAGLGLPYKDFRINSVKIEEEFLPVMDPENFLHGRKRFWQALLARPTIFRTSDFAHLEWAARTNIAIEMRGLEAGYLPSQFNAY